MNESVTCNKMNHENMRLKKTKTITKPNQTMRVRNKQHGRRVHTRFQCKVQNGEN